MNLPNIERSAFRPGEYVGYAAGGVWLIKRTWRGRGWEASTRDPIVIPERGPDARHYSASDRTLAGLSARLSSFHKANV